MTKKQKILEIAESIKLPPGWKIRLNLEIVKSNRDCPIDTTRISLDDDTENCHAKLTREGNIYQDTLQDSIEALEILKQIYEKQN